MYPKSRWWCSEAGVELILKESIRVNLAIENRKKEDDDRRNGKDGRGRKSDKEQTAFVDSTVQEKNVTFPTDSKLLNKITDHCHKVAKAEGIKVRQSYSREIKRLKLTQRFRGKSHSRQNAIIVWDGTSTRVFSETPSTSCLLPLHITSKEP